MGKEELPFKGFAYKKNSQKPMVLHGHSRDEILGRLAEINSTRGGEEKYINLSLGEYDALAGDYGNYRRLDAMTGKDITPVYLELPRLNREEFTSVVAYLKENGAKFNTHRKQWYTTPDRADQLRNYLAGKEKNEVSLQDNLPGKSVTAGQEGTVQDGNSPESGRGLPDNVSRGLRMIDSADCKFELKLRDGSTMHLDMGTFLSRLGGHLRFEVDLDSLVNELAAEVDRNSRLVELDGEYMASVAGGTENRCTVCYTGPGGERPSLVLDGGSLGVCFRDMDDSGVRRAITEWMERHPGWEKGQQEIPEKAAEPESPGQDGLVTGEVLPSPGDMVTLYVPEYMPYRYSEIISGIETVTGTITKISEDPMMEGHYLYTLENSDGDCCISTGETYSLQQADFLRGITGLSAEEFDVLATPGLGMERMQAIYQGYREGLTADQAAYMADPSLADWRAEVWHQGMKNGLLCRDISSTLEYYEDDAEGCRKYLETLARDHRQEMLRDIKSHGYSPSPVILARIDRIRGMLQKDWKLSDICNAYRQRTYEAHPAGKEIDSLAGDFRKQEIARMPPVQER